MKNKQLKLISLVLSILVFIFGAVFLVSKNRAQINLLNDDLGHQAYTFIRKDELLAKVDNDVSNYDNLSILVKNDDFMEFEINNQLQDLYDSYDLKLKDSNLVPLGKDVKVIYRARKGKSEANAYIEASLEDIPFLKFYDADHKEVNFPLTYTIESEEDLDNILKIKAYSVTFNDKEIEVELQIDHQVDLANNGEYIIYLGSPENYFYDEIKVLVDKEEVIVVENIDEEVEEVQEVEEVVVDEKPVIIKDEGKKADSLDRIDVLVNKEYHLNANDVPNLTSIPGNYAINNNFYAQAEAVSSFVNLVDTMQAETGMRILVTSAYRSYTYQATLFDNYAARDGIEAASRYSARPGQSEHQTGLALDVLAPNDSMLNFGSSQQSVWVANNAHRFGFIIRFPLGKEHITGYQYEPWHLRYLGNDLAQSVLNSTLTYDEYWQQYIN